MLTLTCRATGGPITVNPLRLSSIAPVVIPDQTGSIIVTVDRERLVVAETTSEIAAMLQPAPEPAASFGPDAAKEAAALLRAMAKAMRGNTFPACAVNEGLGLPPEVSQGNTIHALAFLADRLDQR